MWIECTLIIGKMKTDLTNLSFLNIRIKNISLIGGIFINCNLRGTEFDIVDIDEINLNGALLINCKWKNLKIHELNRLEGHSDYVRSVCFLQMVIHLLLVVKISLTVYGMSKQVNIKPNWMDIKEISIQYVALLDSNTLVSGSNVNSISLWDVKTGEQKAQLNGHSNIVYSACFSSDGNTLASGSDESIRLWDVKYDSKNSNQKVIIKLPNQFVSLLMEELLTLKITLSVFWMLKQDIQKKFEGHTNTIRSVCFSNDGNQLASAKAKLEGHYSIVTSVCFSPNGSTLASCSLDNSICLWVVKTGINKVNFGDPFDTVRSIYFTPDGNKLVTNNVDDII
ncbi:unnamed protein product [Paramecium pentaurelia]|uniref:Uncharacterized protein n=1 Tax=Paramecium pentaurelia TaxID=43138 RepID=A0A8S1YK70_9CILI|nr:unnamed protein product [Paramecium pentaurelia]